MGDLYDSLILIVSFFKSLKASVSFHCNFIENSTENNLQIFSCHTCLEWHDVNYDGISTSGQTILKTLYQQHVWLVWWQKIKINKAVPGFFVKMKLMVGRTYNASKSDQISVQEDLQAKNMKLVLKLLHISYSAVYIMRCNVLSPLLGGDAPRKQCFTERYVMSSLHTDALNGVCLEPVRLL